MKNGTHIHETINGTKRLEKWERKLRLGEVDKWTDVKIDDTNSFAIL